ncbi:MAG: type II secretion system F family protein [Candidatus Omnitrophica bacterium]|nr:type II secretion system F family protein [Candidatus Omnitrophota bacterium]
MPKYQYTARDEFGKQVRGLMVAQDETDLGNKLDHLGYVLTGIKSKTRESKAKIKSKGLNQSELLEFTLHLSTLLNAGVPLVTGLRDLARDAENPSLQKSIDEIRQRVEAGSSLKESAEAFPRSFPKLYTAILGVGESTGKLGDVLTDLSKFMEWQMELKAKIKEAATYPIIIFTVMILVVTALMIKVIPIFEPLFSDVGVKLPTVTLVLINTSKAIRQYWYVVLLAIAGFIFLFKTYAATERGRYNIDSIKLRLPILGDLVRKIAISRFCHILALALRSGMDLLSALTLGADVTANERLSQSIQMAKKAVNYGEKLANALEVSEEFPPLVIRMVSLGEQSGALTYTLDKVNEYYDKEVPATIKRFFTLFEPLIIIFMGVMVATIALAVLLPIFTLVQMVG